MRAIALLSLFALSGCASVALLVSHYMIGMRSQLSEARDMTVRFDGKVVCGARVSKGAVADCGPISYLPSIATVSWKISPFEWAATDRQRHSAVVRVNGHVPPWFTNGDAIVFTITKSHGLSVAFDCERLSRACVGVPQVQLPVQMQ